MGSLSGSEITSASSTFNFFSLSELASSSKLMAARVNPEVSYELLSRRNEVMLTCGILACRYEKLGFLLDSRRGFFRFRKTALQQSIKDSILAQLVIFGVFDFLNLSFPLLVFH